MRKVVDYFSNNESTVNVCSLDLRQAFERLNICALFVKLMDIMSINFDEDGEINMTHKHLK